jgi:hypothetical protein
LAGFDDKENLFASGLVGVDQVLASLLGSANFSAVDRYNPLSRPDTLPLGARTGLDSVDERSRMWAFVDCQAVEEDVTVLHLMEVRRAPGGKTDSPG